MWQLESSYGKKLYKPQNVFENNILIMFHNSEPAPGFSLI